MSDNQEVDVVQDTENQESQVHEPTEIEKRALEMGWRPRTEFSGEDNDFIDAKEFVQRKPLYDKIAAQGKQLKNVSTALEALKGHYTAVRETEYKRALQKLKDERKEALREGDADKVVSLEDDIKSAEEEFEQLKEENARPIVQEEAPIHPEFTAWKDRNPWYSSTKYMREFADEYGLRLASQGMLPAEVLKKVDMAVRKEFPHKFSNPNKADAPDVGASKTGGRTKAGDPALTEIERMTMNSLIRSGTMTKEEYLADLKKIKETK